MNVSTSPADAWAYPHFDDAAAVVEAAVTAQLRRSVREPVPRTSAHWLSVGGVRRLPEASGTRSREEAGTSTQPC